MAKKNCTAAAVIIGNEILSGKVTDTNSSFLAKELRSVGVSLARIVVLPDDVEAIADAVRRYHERYDFVVTSGGVGPTHDDITMLGVARALGCPLVRHPALERQIREIVGADVNEAILKMAETPEGAEPVSGSGARFPVVRARNIYILPGIPEIFREKLLAIKERFAVDPFFLRVVYSAAYESTLAPYLDATLATFPDVLLGSYPKIGNEKYRVRVTLESKNREYVDRAFEDLVARLPAGSVVDTE